MANCEQTLKLAEINAYPMMASKPSAKTFAKLLHCHHLPNNQRVQSTRGNPNPCVSRCPTATMAVSTSYLQTNPTEMRLHRHPAAKQCQLRRPRVHPALLTTRDSVTQTLTNHPQKCKSARYPTYPTCLANLFPNVMRRGYLKTRPRAQRHRLRAPINRPRLEVAMLRPVTVARFR